MGAVLATFGIDWRLLLINAVNFGILMAALWYFLYKPVMAMLEERRKRVAKGVADAQEAARALSEIEASRAAALSKAGKEADKLLDEARAAAQLKEREIIARGEAQAQRSLEDASKQAAELKTQALEESKREVAALIVLGIEKARQK